MEFEREMWTKAMLQSWSGVHGAREVDPSLRHGPYLTRGIFLRTSKVEVAPRAVRFPLTFATPTDGHTSGIRGA